MRRDEFDKKYIDTFIKTCKENIKNAPLHGTTCYVHHGHFCRINICPFKGKPQYCHTAYVQLSAKEFIKMFASKWKQIVINKIVFYEDELK